MAALLFLAGLSFGCPAGLAFGVLGCSSVGASLFGHRGLDALAAAATAPAHALILPGLLAWSFTAVSGAGGQRMPELSRLVMVCPRVMRSTWPPERPGVAALTTAGSSPAAWVRCLVVDFAGTACSSLLFCDSM
jgi:hypothetical protein